MIKEQVNQNSANNQAKKKDKEPPVYFPFDERVKRTGIEGCFNISLMNIDFSDKQHDIRSKIDERKKIAKKHSMEMGISLSIMRSTQ